MPTTRLLPQQFGPGCDVSGTRIEQNVLELARLCNDVPADLVGRRWSPSPVVWGFSPPSSQLGTPFLDERNASSSFATNEAPDAEDIANEWRVKSTLFAGGQTQRAWQVSLVASRPIIVGGLTLLAETQSGAGARYTNVWKYGAAPPTGYVAGDPCRDLTLQVCVSDGWDLENRRKLRQEALVAGVRSDAFLNQTPAAAPAHTALPAHPLAPVWQGFVVEDLPLVLVPAEARLHFILTVPVYSAAGNSTWSTTTPEFNNVWNLCAQVWEATR